MIFVLMFVLVHKADNFCSRSRSMEILLLDTIRNRLQLRTQRKTTYYLAEVIHADVNIQQNYSCCNF